MDRFEFIEGKVPLEKINSALTECSSNQQTGAQATFMGQVRNDRLELGSVSAIEYTTKNEMAQKIMQEIMNECQQQFQTHSIQVMHSLGLVYAGEICLLVVVACKHRKNSFAACEYLVERLKKELPVWGKELMDDLSHQWKQNT